MNLRPYSTNIFPNLNFPFESSLFKMVFLIIWLCHVSVRSEQVTGSTRCESVDVPDRPFRLDGRQLADPGSRLTARLRSARYRQLDADQSRRDPDKGGDGDG